MNADGVQAWRCAVCGYVHRGGQPPDCCPVCGSPPSDFRPHAETERPAAGSSAKTTRWQCLNCSYIHDGPEPPDECPVCGAAKDRFEPIEDSQQGQAAGATDFAGHLIVIGAGIAGLSAVEAFRNTTGGGTVTLLSREPDLPYYRLNLTRYLAGEISDTELPVHDADWFARKNIDFRPSADVAGISCPQHQVSLRDGATLPYDKLIVTVGAHPFVPPIAGAQREGVISLRTVRDARAILESLHPGMQCAVIGGGLLGLEVAGALAARGTGVTVLEAHDWLMPRQLNRRAGEILQEHVESLGITVRKNVRTKELLGDERVASVQAEDGAAIPADLVVLATGIRPNSHLARRIGLVVNKGIVVDNHLASSHPDLYAAGDVAEHQGVLYGNWAASQFQGGIAGMNAAGAGVEFGGIPRSNTLKVLGLDLLSIGQFEPEDGSFQVIETRAGGDYYRFIFRDEHLVGAVFVGDTSLSGRVRHAIEAGTDFSGDILENISAEAFMDELRGTTGG